MGKKAIILFSGGLDSTTCLAMAKAEGYALYALTFHYNQKHQGEVDAAKRIAKQFSVTEQKIISLDFLSELGTSALTDHSLVVPDYQGNNSIPTTYVPARNTIFLSMAIAWAEVIGTSDIFIGANVIDYSGYPDCRPDYLRAFEKMADLATKAGVEGKQHLKIHAPLLHLNKSQIIQAGIKLGIDYSMTVSCYRLDAAGRSCGCCDSCIYRKKGFFEAGIADPTIYL
jgi:7-cyano-7-deazaguanine synthase